MREGLQVRLGAAGDLDAIVALERATAEAPHWAVANYEAILGGRDGDSVEGLQRCLFVAEGAAGLVGFAVGAFAAGVCGELESVAVDADWRRAGIGRVLCGAVVEWCKARGVEAVELEVRAWSAGAIALYEDLGFVEVGRRPGYYREPEEDAVLMRLGLAG